MGASLRLKKRGTVVTREVKVEVGSGDPRGNLSQEVKKMEEEEEEEDFCNFIC